MWTYNMSDELYHHGIKGQKWGVRRENNYKNAVNNMKKKHSSQRYKNDIEYYKKMSNDMIKKGYKKWADENYLDDYNDSDKKGAFEEELNFNKKQIASVEHWMKSSSTLTQKLSNIDISNMRYKDAMRMVRQVENDWINETIESDPGLR